MNNKNIVIYLLILLLGISVYLNLKDDNSQRKYIEQNIKAEEAFGNQIGELPLFSSACFPTYKQICTYGECEIITDLGTSFSLLDNLNTDQRTISRCDSNGCDTYDAQYYASGLYENYQAEQPRGFFLKKENKSLVDTETTSYTEVATQGVTTFLYSGYCKDVK